MACPACITGSLDEGEPKGVEETLLPDITCYVSRPEPSKSNGNAVILGTDVFGHKLINARLIADTFAQQGYLCVIPDYLENDPMNMATLELMESVSTRSLLGKLAAYLQLLGALLGMIRWLKRHPEAHAVDVVGQLSKLLREKQGIKKVGFQGYCYGGSVGVLLGSKPDVVDAISIAHPGLVKLDDIKKITVPMLFLCAESDFTFGAKIRTLAMKAMHDKQPGLAEFILYPGTQHGFAVRGNKHVPAVNAAREDALKRAIAFFGQHLGGPAAAAAAAGAEQSQQAATEPVGVKLDPASTASKQSGYCFDRPVLQRRLCNGNLEFVIISPDS